MDIGPMTKEQIEDAMLQISDHIQEDVENRCFLGEVQPDEMENMYKLLKDWSNTCRKMLEIVT
jgi:hypothetical protein